jgi:hypothetical protein
VAFIREEEEAIDDHPQKCALTIMHCPHINGFSLVLANFSFLPHILQQQRHTICRFCFFILKNILLFAAATAIPSPQSP